VHASDGGAAPGAAPGADGAPPCHDGCPVGVTAAAMRPAELSPHVAAAQRCGPMPSLEELAADYRARADGTVMLHGRPQRVTHPIASFGMETMDLDAKANRDTQAPAAA